jgi:ferredoxin
MSYIIGNKCDGVCDTACVTVCPVDVINGPIHIDGLGKEVKGMTAEEKKGLQLFINPEECILCGACIPECPVDAIFESEKEALKVEGNDISIVKNYEFYGKTWEGLK